MRIYIDNSRERAAENCLKLPFLALDSERLNLNLWPAIQVHKGFNIGVGFGISHVAKTRIYAAGFGIDAADPWRPWPKFTTRDGSTSLSCCGFFVQWFIY